ncbi:hypothetical protein [Candidatus Coxiella mudrowiae]|uniref:hypothetical protein n=1 Tax=Candidatus Coxiella mudrowiae TaxID=2054173 RepID=UPI003CC82445
MPHFANHAKIWVVDDRLFYVSSHNLYPSNLQEFGYVINNKKINTRIFKSILE